MPRTPLPKGFKGSENLPQTNEKLENCFYSRREDKEEILSRPGISLLNATGSVDRGSFEWNGSLYYVMSETLIKITNTTTGAFSTIGTIAESNPVKWAVGFTFVVIIVERGNLYTLSTADALVDITGNSNIVSCVDVAFMNDRWIYIPADGSVAFFSDVGAPGTVQATSFFDAASLPDSNNGAFNLNNTLYITGTDSIDLFKDVGADPVPFQRIEGSSIRHGLIGGLQEYENTFFFIGRKKDQNAAIFAVAAGVAPKISNSRIDLLLSTYSETELGNAVTSRFVWRGHDIVTWTLARDSFAYLNEEWFILSVLDDGDTEPWGAGYVTEFQGDYFTSGSGRIGKLAKINKEYGASIPKVLGIGAANGDSDWFTVQSIQLGIAQGFNSAVGSVSLRMSRDNVTFGPELFIDLGAIGQYDKLLKYNPPGGLGAYQGFFGFEIYTAEDIDFSLYQIIMELR